MHHVNKIIKQQYQTNVHCSLYPVLIALRGSRSKEVYLILSNRKVERENRKVDKTFIIQIGQGHT